eukprot:1926686-Pleurochrysis_carterae.AAC.1
MPIVIAIVKGGGFDFVNTQRFVGSIERELRQTRPAALKLLEKELAARGADVDDLQVAVHTIGVHTIGIHTIVIHTIDVHTIAVHTAAIAVHAVAVHTIAVHTTAIAVHAVAVHTIAVHTIAVHAIATREAHARSACMVAARIKLGPASLVCVCALCGRCVTISPRARLPGNSSGIDLSGGHYRVRSVWLRRSL